jgi:hypothetical protein
VSVGVSVMVAVAVSVAVGDGSVDWEAVNATMGEDLDGGAPAGWQAGNRNEMEINAAIRNLQIGRAHV